MATIKKNKTYGEGRICEGADCTTRLSRFNMDHICATCQESIPIEDLPLTTGSYI